MTNLRRPPDSFPIAFHEVVRRGWGFIEADAMPWAPRSTIVRFRAFVRVLRESPTHPLHERARARWQIVAGPLGGLRIEALPPRASPASERATAQEVLVSVAQHLPRNS